MISNWIQEFIHSGALLGIDRNRFLVGWGNAVLTDRPAPGATAFFVPDFFLTSPRAWYQPEHWRILSRAQLQDELQLLLSETSECFPHVKWEAASRSQFESSFERLQGLFHSGELRKGVPFIFDRGVADWTGDQVATVLARILAFTAHLPVTPYGFWNPREGILGASPELLFRHEALSGNRGRIATMALAGTRRREDSTALPLLEDSKELVEHRWVIDGIREALAPYGRLEVGSTEVVDLASLSHLKTPIELELSGDFEFEKIVRALHPTPALGAFPREAGMKWLWHEDQDVSRDRFGAPFGAIWPRGDETQEALCVVAIRNVQWKGAETRLCAGCGVVAESILDREWAELHGKLRAIREMTGLS